MTFTDQNFTRLPLSNIRQSVLSWGPSCHLNWGAELREKHADGNVVLLKKSLYMNNSFSKKTKAGVFLFPQTGNHPKLYKLCDFHATSSGTSHQSSSVLSHFY